VGTLLDTTVFIDLERAVRRLPPGSAMAEVSARLEQQLESDEEVGIAAITAAELLHGVHRASTEHRVRREAFVEAVLAAFPPLPFGLLAARAHAQIWAGLAAAGQDVGAHDRLVAATAITSGWRVGTANLRHFDRIPESSPSPSPASSGALTASTGVQAPP
jgi:tRNA(fMet)-specific endonuclease VapC